ncbi:CATRA conflict system CASPASE/TPR repeat-associated protein [Streptomyces phaeochromogenes]
MTDYGVTEQEIVIHVFAPLDGTPRHAGRTALTEVWNRFRALQRADTPVFRSLPADFPGILSPAPLHGSLPLAAVQSADKLDQAVLRRNQEVLNLSLLLGAAPERTWSDLEQRVEEIAGPSAPAQLGAVTLLLGKTPMGGTDILSQASPGPETDTDPVRRLRLLVPAGRDGRLSAWAWSADGGPEMPAFVRYLMHFTVLRYQLAVYHRLRGDWAAATHTPPLALIRVPFAPAAGYRELVDPLEQLRAMRQCVDAAWDNARQALGNWRDAEGSALADTHVLDDDRTLVAWFTQALEDDMAHAQLGERQPSSSDAQAPADEPSASTGGPARAREVTPVPDDHTAADAQAGPAPRHRDKSKEPVVRILAVCDEWFPANGGLSTLNRLLCGALAAAGADVIALVVGYDEKERTDAQNLGVRLLDAERPGHTGREALMRRPRLPKGWEPDLVVGHGRVSGPAARTQAEDHFPGVKRLQILHVEPDQAEWHRTTHPDGDVGAVVDERTALEVDLCRGAWRTGVVGPRLESALVRQRWVPGFDDLGAPLRLDPGFDAVLTVQGAPPPSTVPRILVMGRLRDHPIKGLDIACRSVGRAVPEHSRPGRWQLTVRGAKDGRSGELFTQVTEWVDAPAVDVNVLPYAPDPRQIAQDVAGSALVLMPSRAEAFGLVGLEAVTAGVPVLVSSRSGLGTLLHDMLPDAEAERLVIDVDASPHRFQRDVERWTQAISSVMYDLPGSFVRAKDLRKRMADQLPWARTADKVLRCLRETDRGA